MWIQPNQLLQLRPRLRRKNVVVGMMMVMVVVIGLAENYSWNRRKTDEKPKRILVDSDFDADDVFALFYLLKQSTSQFDLQGITINTNGWSDGGHAINHVYDILYMMGRDDIPVGVGGEGSILPNGTVLPNVGGFLPIIDQGMSTSGGCRYRQAIPVGKGGRLDVNSNYGLRKSFLPQGNRQYVPMEQATAQEVMINATSKGPITVFLMGAHTNFAIFLITNPHLKQNVEHIYVMGCAIRSSGNLYPLQINPFAEFNIFSDPLAAYTVLHSGIPVTIIPLDASNTIPITHEFFSEFESRQHTFEANYCFNSLKMIRLTWPNTRFYQEYCMWDTFMVGIALSIMKNSHNHHLGDNEFAHMEFMNITVVTSNQPYGVSDGSNTLNSGQLIHLLNIENSRLHTGHVQTGMQDPFCLEIKGGCQDGRTKEVRGFEAVRVLVATAAKLNRNMSSSLDKAFYTNFLDVLNQPEQTARSNYSAQFAYYKEVLYQPNFTEKSEGKTLVFDMDMSAGDFVALIYLLKLPKELINLKGILVSSTGWATAATIDVVYDVLHMMGRDDIPVGLGNVFAIGEKNPTFDAIGDCKYAKAIPHGCGGFLDSDTLYGLARELPRSPRRYTAETSGRFRQPSAVDVWKTIVESLDAKSSVILLTNGPLTNLAEIIRSENTSSMIQEVFIVGGNIGNGNEKGNIFTIPSNEYAEFNIFLDPLAAKAVLESDLNITLIPLSVQRAVSSFPELLTNLKSVNHTPEATFVQSLLSRLWQLKQEHSSYYHHMDIFSGEILGAVIQAGKNSYLKQMFNFKKVKILAEGNVSDIGQIINDEEEGKLVKILENIYPEAYYQQFAKVLSNHSQSAVIGSFQEQKKIWSTPPNYN